jgi:hypothetical protein
MLIGVMALAAATAAPAPVTVGKFNETAFPKAVLRERRMPQEELTARADIIMKAKVCSFPGQTVDRYAITVPYAVLLQPSGTITKVVVRDVGCPDLEILTGQVANELGKAGDFKPTGAAGDQWYIGEVFYGHGGQDLARTVTDDDKLICEERKRATGSNLAMQRDCRTAAQWQVYRLERERMRRDLLSDGANLDTSKQ